MFQSNTLLNLGNQNSRPYLVELAAVPHEYGDLVWLQEDRPLPFTPRRIYFVHDIPAHARRGGHAHREISELLVVVRGAVTVTLETREGEQLEFRLESPRQGLYLPAHWWRELVDFAADSCLLVAASGLYNESEYIRTKSEFLEQ